MRQPWRIGGSEVVPGSEIHETEVDDELRDLHNGDVLLPPDFDATRRLEVVPVHYDVHGKI